MSVVEVIGTAAGVWVGAGLYCVSRKLLRLALLASVLAMWTPIAGSVGRYVLVSRWGVEDAFLATLVCIVYVCARLRLSFMAATTS